MKCPSCGASNLVQIDMDKYQCPYCGKTSSIREVSIPQQAQQPVFDNVDNFTFEEDDTPKVWMNILCLLIPIVGIVMYFVKKDTQPNCAKSYLNYALIGFGIDVLWNIIAVL